MYRIDIGIDLGTSNTRVFMRDKGIVINQPSVIAYDKKTKKIEAVGTKAKRMIGKTTENTIVERPVKHSVISNYTLTERMIKAFIKNALSRRRIWGRPNICVTIPCGITEVEKKAVMDAVLRTGARTVYLLERPLAGAIGAGIDIFETSGHMVVDIGGGTTEISVISSGGISEVRTLKFGGDDFTEALIRYVRRRYNVELGEVSAEDSKIDGASLAYTNEADTFEIRGKNLLNGLPVKLDITTNETVPIFAETGTVITDAIASVLDVTEPELVSDITKEGILIAGGGSLLPGLSRFIGDKTGLKVITGDNPGDYVVLGAGSAGEYITIEDSIRK